MRTARILLILLSLSFGTAFAQSSASDKVDPRSSASPKVEKPNKKTGKPKDSKQTIKKTDQTLNLMYALAYVTSVRKP